MVNAMNKYTVCLAAIALSFSSATMACCYVKDMYLVTKVKAGSFLNVRREPHPLSAIVATLSHNQRYFSLQRLAEKKREMRTHKLCVAVTYSRIGGRQTTSKWCKLREPSGWVNMHYLTSCEVEYADMGNVIRTECDGINIGDSISDF